MNYGKKSAIIDSKSHCVPGRCYAETHEKRFASELKSSTNPFSTWMSEIGLNSEGTRAVYTLFDDKSLFSYAKPISLVKSIIEQATDNDDIILDFFSGSATTAHAVMQLNAEDGGNRRYIMVQFPELCDEKSEAYKAGYPTICEIGKERIRRAGAQITAGDTGFRVFKLDTSNLKTWDATPIEGAACGCALTRTGNG